MGAAPKQSPTTEAEVDVAATVLADMNMMPSLKIGNHADEDNSSVVSVRANPSTSLVVDDWRNDLDDKLLRNEMTMNM
jgi:hypothetical protein